MKYKIIQTSWKKSHRKLSEVRRKVFIEEQQVAEELEWDKYDTECFHILLTDKKNNAIATGRMKKNGHIGRMAVLKQYRNQGIGSAILNKLTDIARRNDFSELYLHAQTSAIGFYQKHDFIICSEEFMDAGILHKTMKKDLSSRLKHSETNLSSRPQRSVVEGS